MVPNSAKHHIYVLESYKYSPCSCTFSCIFNETRNALRFNNHDGFITAAIESYRKLLRMNDDGVVAKEGKSNKFITFIS